MSQIKVTALKTFSFKGKTVETGQGLTMPEHAARIYSKIDFVKVDADDEAKLAPKKAPVKKAK